jgi:hypothetical protein
MLRHDKGHPLSSATRQSIAWQHQHLHSRSAMIIAVMHHTSGQLQNQCMALRMIQPKSNAERACVDIQIELFNTEAPLFSMLGSLCLAAALSPPPRAAGRG